MARDGSGRGGTPRGLKLKTGPDATSIGAQGMAQTIRQIAEALGARAEGALDLEIDGLAEPAAAGPRDLALAMADEYLAGLGLGQARAAVLEPGTDW